MRIQIIKNMNYVPFFFTFFLIISSQKSLPMEAGNLVERAANTQASSNSVFDL